MDADPALHSDRPQVLERDGRWHLFFSCWKKMVSRDWAARYITSHDGLAKEWTDNSLYHFEASRPEGPFEPAPGGAIVKGSGAMGLYGTQLIELPGQGEDLDVIGWFTKRNALAVSGEFGLRWWHGEPPVMYARRQAGAN